MRGGQGHTDSKSLVELGQQSRAQEVPAPILITFLLGLWPGTSSAAAPVPPTLIPLPSFSAPEPAGLSAG